jgi:hypothetical protein
MAKPNRYKGKSEQVIRSAASKVMWVGRATVFLVGLDPGHKERAGPL